MSRLDKRLLGQITEIIRDNPDSPSQAAEEVLLRVNRHHSAKKLSPLEVRAVRASYRKGESQAEIAEAFDVNPATISRIVRGEYH